MRKSIAFLITATMIVAASSASNAQTITSYGDTVSISADRSCIRPEIPVVLTAEVISDIDTTGIVYTWKYLLHGETIWYDVPDSNRSELIVEYSQQVRHYAVRIRMGNVSAASNQIIVCPCGVTNKKSLDILRGGVSPTSGHAVLQFEPSGYEQIVLQTSSDARSFQTVANINGTTEYRSAQQISGTLYYRIKGITEFGVEEYGNVFKVSARSTSGIDYEKPFDAKVVTSNGTILATFVGMTAPNPTSAYASIKSRCNTLDRIIFIECRQGDKTEMLKVLR